ncbi:extracellular solute-binding protein [Paenibacillus sp. LMG 31459]|uniref:Extracellular solute-binding protein n=1 Tax=Paenibacillus phytohabitans TaxID=2654978 RepID=A0ABX1YT97_9BACL|nr:ABC transporter substrate-binding protein [Paenibacillus phytohabitans]NOU83789.1 extracellular solute-binding protein [Paenibacillus phytohabitans]
MKKKLFGVLASVLLASSVLSGCGGNNNGGNSNAGKGTEGSGGAETAQSAAPESGNAGELKPVELTWYYPLSQLQADQEKVQEEVNKLVKAKINATVKLMPVAIGDYVQKMNTVLAAGEKFDILWTGYMLKPEELVRKGAIQPMDALLDEYAPELKADVPQVMWDGLSVDGEIYGIPNQQINGSRYGFIIQKRFADKYNLDTASIKKIADIEPFLAQIKQNEPDIIPFGLFGTSFINPQSHDDKYWVVPGLDDHFYIKTDDPTYTLQRYPEEELDNFRLASKWYKEGYIYKDAATEKMNDYLVKGQIAVDFNVTLKPGVEAEVKAKNGGNEVITVPLSDWFSNGYSATTNQSISRTAPNPERAMMFLNLVNTDKELYNLLCNGVVGEHYDRTNGEYIKAKADSRYLPNMDWVFGSVFNSYLKEGQPENVWEETKKINSDSEVNPVGAFKFNSEPVNTEIANLNAVWGEYKRGLVTGTLDFEETWPALYGKLKEAGEEKYVEEVTKQFEQFLKDKGLKK